MLYLYAVVLQTLPYSSILMMETSFFGDIISLENDNLNDLLNKKSVCVGEGGGEPQV
jgi:hypothetical protein